MASKAAEAEAAARAARASEAEVARAAVEAAKTAVAAGEAGAAQQLKAALAQQGGAPPVRPRVTSVVRRGAAPSAGAPCTQQRGAAAM